MSDALRSITGAWMKKIRLAIDWKAKEFQDDADECMRFFDGPYDWLYQGWRQGGSRGFDWGEGDDNPLPSPSSRMTVNKVAELVQLFGPALYHRNPVRKVIPRKIVEPVPELFGDVNTDPNAAMMFQQAMSTAGQQIMADALRADLLEKYLGYTPAALDLKEEARSAIDEALIKGAGCLWTGKYSPEGSRGSFAGTFFDSVDNLVLDPDANKMRDVRWIARKHTHPAWYVERLFGLAPDTFRGFAHQESYTRQSETADRDGDWKRRQGQTADLVVYWEIWSRMGLGGRLSGIPNEDRQKFDTLGDYVRLVITDTIPWPLNLPPPLCDLLTQQQEMVPADVMGQITQRMTWDTPYWADDSWPVTLIKFHNRPGKLWPMSHMKPGMGELKFLNWAWSFLANKVKIATRDFLAIAKSAGEELKERIKHGADYTIIEIEAIHGSIDKVVQFLQYPGFNPEIWKVIEGVTLNFERRVGLTELIYGLSSRQMRSAQEASIKSDAISVRPDEMANRVEDAMTEVARKEAFAARWHLRGPDVERVLGPLGAQVWEQVMVTSDPGAVLHQLEYRIEANSARKPNKAADQEKMKEAMQNLFQPILQYSMSSGDVNPINALMRDWAKSIDLEAEAYLFQPPPPPPMPAGPQQAPPA